MYNHILLLMKYYDVYFINSYLPQQILIKITYLSKHIRYMYDTSTTQIRTTYEQHT